MRQRIINLAFLAVRGVGSTANAQYIRIGNPGAIPTAGLNAPTVLRSTAALYTEDARTHAIEGTVTIEAVIDEKGRVTSSRILKGLGFGLDQVALESLQDWQISPGTRNGLPVSVAAQIDVEFNLRSANALRMGAGLTPPTVLTRVPPQYTPEAVRAGVGGAVVLQAVVKSDGIIDILRVVRGLPFGLTDSAIDALKQWRFQPGQQNGQNADIALNVEVNFNIEKKR
jgi:TonB family protein